MPGRWANALVVLTRPQGRNEALAQRLGRHGIETLAMPVLDIVPAPKGPDLPPCPQDYDLVVFVSGNAVACYLQQLRQAGAIPSAWPAHTLVAAVGTATAQAVLDTGLAPSELVLSPGKDDDQDSEALWKHLEPLVAGMGEALIVRGQDGREWLGERLEVAGLRVVRHASYERRMLQWPASSANRLRGCVQSGRPVICLLTSAHGVQAFVDNVVRHDLLPECAGFHYLVIHPRIASRLQSSLESPSGKVGELAFTVSSPAEEAIAQAVLSLASR